MSSSLSFDSMESLESSSDSSDQTDAPPLPIPLPNPERKTRKTITQDIVRMVVIQVSRKERPPIKQIAENVGLAPSTVYKLLRELREGKHDYGDFVLYSPAKRGRKPVITTEMSERVRDILTSAPTETIDTAKERLNNDGVEVSRSSIWRMARSQQLSHQMIVPKPAAVFTRRITQQRFEYAQQVNGRPDQVLWFLDESGFNLHLGPLRCWSDVGVTPVQAVPANRGQNVSLLMCIAPTDLCSTRQSADHSKRQTSSHFSRRLLHASRRSDVEKCVWWLIMRESTPQHLRPGTLLKMGSIMFIFLRILRT